MLTAVERSTDVSASLPVLPSKNQLKTAGDRIRRRVTGALELDGEQAAVDAQLIKTWRSAHSGALTTTRNGLGLIVRRTLGLESQAGLVTQRLKRFESIVSKLVRAKTRLGEMEDIAGCRAVLPSLIVVREVETQLAGARKLDVIDVRDYNNRPHLGGYRALHLWCRRDGFKVEVQLRTALQQEWAERIEEWDKLLGLDLKHERAPEVVLLFFRELANYYRHIDAGMAPSMVEASALQRARTSVRAWLTREV